MSRVRIFAIFQSFMGIQYFACCFICISFAKIQTNVLKAILQSYCCGFICRFDPRAFRWALSMKLAVEEINNRKDLLSNHTLAYRIFDSCSTPVTAQKAVLAVLNGQDVVQSSMCSGAGPLLGLIGESGSSQSIVLSRTVQPFQIPMVISFFFLFMFCILET